jgi:aminopeptidase
MIVLQWLKYCKNVQDWLVYNRGLDHFFLSHRRIAMNDPRINRLADVYVGYSTEIQPGDRVLIEAEPAAEPIVRATFKAILEAGGHPHLFISLGGQTTLTGLDEVFLEYANEDQLAYAPTFYNLVYEQFEARIRIHSESNTRRLSGADKSKLAKRETATHGVLESQFRRGETREFKWLTTLFPTQAYAQDSEMNLTEFEDFVFRACHVDESSDDPVAYWKEVAEKQQVWVDAFDGHELVEVRGPDVDLKLSIKGRTFLNARGRNNMPDGEIYTGPVEDSVNGRVRFSYPCAYRGNEVNGVELVFENGRVVSARADKNQEFLERMLDADHGARHLGEFAIGLNYGVDRVTKNILFDEKVGGSIHMALGAGYPETGSQNESAIHWDLITDMRNGGEIIVDGETFYENGFFTI